MSGAGLSSLSHSSKYADGSEGISTDLNGLEDLCPADSSTARLEYCLSEPLISPPSLAHFDLLVAVLLFPHAAVAMKEGAGSHGQRIRRDVAHDDCAWT